MATTAIQRIPEQPGSYRFGRHVEHDPRSRTFALGVLHSAAIRPVQWTRRVPIFDQKALGSCTGQAAVGLVGTDNAARTGLTEVHTPRGQFPVDEAFGVAVYGLATTLDTIPGAYPPDDSGSTGLAAAKALQQLGIASGYLHAFSVEELKSALQVAPVMIGVVWLRSMLEPSAGGLLVVDPSSPVVGGHELIVSGWDGARFKLDNSWGAAWGVGGSCYVSEADMRWLLAQQGDVTVPQFSSAPAPTPSPAPAAAVTAAELAGDIRGLLTSKGV